MCHDAPSSFLNGFDYRIAVPGKDRSQINDFAGNTDFLSALDGHTNLTQLHAVAYNCDVRAFHHDLSLS